MRYLLIILSLCFSCLQAATVPLSYTLEVTDVNGNKLFETVDYSLTDEIIIPERVEVVPSGGNGVLLLYGAPGAISRNLYVIARLLGGSELGFEAQPGGSFFRRFNEDQFVDDKPQVVEVDVDEFRLSSNPVFPPGKSGRLVINYEPGMIDPEAPIIRHTFREGIRYRGENGVAHRTFGVQVIDDNDFVMELRVNDELIVSSNQEPNIVPVTFKEGLNKVDIQATNSLGKTTEINFDKIVLDTTGPTFFIDQVDNIVTNNARFDISGTIFDVNPAGYDIFVNGQRRGGRLLTVSDSRVIASVPLELGNNTISIVARDDFSNRSTYTLNNIFYAQVGEPGIILTSNSGFTTNNSSYNLEANIEGNGVVTTQVFFNNNLFLTTTDRNINTPLILTEGINSIKIVSTDENLSVSELEVDNIILDTVSPLLSWNSPQGVIVGSSDYNVDFNVIDSSEVVSRLFLNDILIETVNVSTFTETYSLVPGANVFRVEISDTAGNELSSLIDTVFYDNSAPAVVVSPENNHVFKGNDPQVITASVTDESNINYSSLRIVLNGSFLNADLFNVDTNTGLISINLDDRQPLRVGDNRLDIVIGDSLGNSGNTRTMFVLEEVVQAEISLVPESNSSFTNIATQQIRANFSGIPGDIDTVNTTVKLNGVLVDSSNISFEVDHLLVNTELSFGSNQFEIELRNNLGDTFNQAAQYDMLDTIAPTAIFEPLSGAEFSVEDLTIKVVVNDDLAKLNPFAVQAMSGGRSIPLGQIQVDGQTININFNSLFSLERGASNLEVNFEDLAGNTNSIVGSFTQTNEFDAPILTEVNPFSNSFSILNPRLTFFYDEESSIDENSLKVLLNGAQVPKSHYTIDLITQNIFLNLSNEFFLNESDTNTLSIELADEFGNTGSSLFTYSASLGPKISHNLLLSSSDELIGIEYFFESIEPIDYTSFLLKFNGIDVLATDPNVIINTVAGSITLNLSESLLVREKRNFSSIAISNHRGQESFYEAYLESSIDANIEFLLNDEAVSDQIIVGTFTPDFKVNYFDPEGVNYNSISIKLNNVLVENTKLETSAIDKQTKILFDENFKLLAGQSNFLEVEYRNIDGRVFKEILTVNVELDTTSPLITVNEAGEVILDDLTLISGQITDRSGVDKDSLILTYIDSNGVESAIPSSNIRIENEFNHVLTFKIDINTNFLIDTDGNIQIKVEVADNIGNQGTFTGRLYEPSLVTFTVNPPGPEINTLTPIVTISNENLSSLIDLNSILISRVGDKIPERNLVIDSVNGVISINFDSDFGLLPGFVNTIQFEAVDVNGQPVFTTINYSAPRESVATLEDKFPPIIESSPTSGSTFENSNTTVLISFLEQNQVDYRRLSIRLNGNEVNESNYTIDLFTNIIELQLQGENSLTEGLNALTVEISDTFGNSNIRNIIYTLDLSGDVATSDDFAPPIVNYNPNDGQVFSLTPGLVVSFGDQSLINFSTFEARLNNIVIDNSLYEIKSERNSIVFREIELIDDLINEFTLSIADIHGNTTNSLLRLDTRKFVDNGAVFVETSTGSIGDTTCVVVQDGKGKCWGLRALGKEPLSTYDVGQVFEDETQSPLISFPEKILKFATGESQICMLLDNGDVKCWGDVRALGHDDFLSDSSQYYGDNISELNPVRVNLPTGSRAMDIVSSKGTVCSLLEDGAVYCWGKNDGLFGNGFDTTGPGDTTSDLAYLGDNISEQVLEPVSLSSGARLLRSNNQGFCAYTELFNFNGLSPSIECWGRQTPGSEIFGHTNELSGANGLLPSDLPRNTLIGNQDVVDFSMSGSSVCIVVYNGVDSTNVYCWGENKSGELGLGIGKPDTNGVIPAGEEYVSFSDAMSQAPVSLGSGDSVFKIIGGSEHNGYCAIFDIGSVKCWGSALSGGVANGDITNNIGDESGEMPPQNINLGVGIFSRDIFTNNSGFCSNNFDGSMSCWGVPFPLNRVETIPPQSIGDIFGDESGEMPPPFTKLDTGTLGESFGSLFFEIAPVYSFSNTLTLPLEVEFYTEGRSAVSYSWDFGDGTPIIVTGEDEVSHIYTQAGSFIAEVTITNDDGTIQTGKEVINVNNPNIKPVSILVANDLIAPPPHDVSFNGFLSFDSDGFIAEYIWNFGDGSDPLTTFTPEVTHTFTEIGDFTVTLSVKDDSGQTTVSNPIVVNINENTSLVGRVLDANDGQLGQARPIEGIVVAVLGTSLITTTDSEGNFRIDGITNPESIIIDFNADNTVGPIVYAGFREAISLRDGEINIIDRPFFLPRIESDTAQAIDPNNTVVVTNNRLGISLEVAPNSARNADGSLYLGDLTISEVPVNLAPVTLPRGTRPDTLITVQPVAIFFDPPAKITFPNTGGIPAGQQFPLTQINPFSGEFDEIGIGEISSDGQRITTVEGGVRYSSWGGVTSMPYEPVKDNNDPFPSDPEPSDPNDPNDPNDSNDSSDPNDPNTPDSPDSPDSGGENEPPEEAPGCEGDPFKACQGAFGSTLNENSGSLLVFHNLASYRSMNQEQNLRLTYNSLRASINPIITKLFKTPARGSTGAFHILSGVLNGKNPNDTCFVNTGVVTCEADSIASNAKKFETLYSFEEGFALNNINTSFIAGTYLNADEFETGVYPYEISMGNKPSASSNQLSTIFSSGRLAIVNKKQSYFGSGWSLSGLDQIYEQDNGDLLYVYGSSGESIYKNSNKSFGLEMRVFDLKGYQGNISGLVDNSFANFNLKDFSVEYRNPDTDNSVSSVSRTVSKLNVSNVDFTRASKGRVLHVGFNNTDDTFGNENPKVDDLIINPHDTGSSTVSYGAILNGYLKVPSNGDINFTIQRSVGQSIKLVVNGQTIISANGNDSINAQGVVESSGTATGLNQGSATIKIIVGTSSDNRLLKLTASGAGLPNFEGFPITREFLSTKPFTDVEEKTYISNSYTFDRIIKRANGSYSRILRNGTQYDFNTDGYLISKSDLNNNTYQYAYDVENKIEKIVDPIGLETTFSYLNGKITEIKAPDMRTTKFTYDGNDLETIEDPDQTVRSFKYDSDSKMMEQTSKRGFKTTYTYNHLSRLIKAEKPGGIVNQATPFQSITIPNKADGVGTFENPFIIKKEADAFMTTTDALGRVTKKRLNPNGFVTEVSNSKGEVTKITRNTDNLVVSRIDARGHEVKLAYDVTGNLVSQTQPDGVVSYTSIYDHRFNKVKRSTNAKGVETINTFDSKGNILSVSESNGRSQAFTYNSRGQVKTATNTNNETTTYFYNADFNLEKITDSNNNSIEFTYDSAGNLETSKDARNNISSFSYDDLNRMTKSTDASNDETLFGYDEEGNLKSVKDALNNTTIYNYDVRGNVEQVTDPRGSIESFGFNLKNLLETHTNRNGDIITYEYDELDRISKKAGASVVTYDYDEVGNLTDMNDEVNRYHYSYDLNNRVIRERVTGFSPTITHHFDYSDTGERVALRNILGTQEYSYNSRNELDKVTSFTGRSFDMDYDEQSRLKTITRDSGVNSLFGYDLAGRLDLIDHGIVSFGYTLDDVGNRKQINQSRLQANVFNPIIDYTYDVTNQLKTAGSSLALADPESFNYDATGNRIGNVVSAGNRLDQDDDFTYTYDLNGNLKSKISRTDSLVQFSYTYDIENRLTSIQSPGKLVEYTYDALGRRVGKKIDTQESKYIYDGDNILMEYLGSNLIRSYTHAPGADNQLGFRDELVSKSYSYLKDGLGSVTDIVDESGQIIESYAYKSFGETIAFDKDGIEKTQPSQIFGYTGREIDVESDLYYYRARYYSPKTGRFISEDPIGFAGYDMNLYRYVNNNPTRLADPSGLRFTDPSAGAISIPESGFFIGGGGTAGAGIDGELSGGYFFGDNFLGDSNSGGFSSEGIGVGIGAGADAFIGYTSDRNINSINLNISYGVGSFTVFFDPDTGRPIGGTLGPGVGFGGSVTKTQTKFSCDER